MSLFEADVAAEVFADNTLPGGEEGVVKKLLQVLCQINVLELGRTGCLLLDELNCLKSHICIDTIG